MIAIDIIAAANRYILYAINILRWSSMRGENHSENYYETKVMRP